MGRVGAEDVVRQEAGERPAAQAEGLQDQVHVLADERALDVQRGQDAQLQVEERHLRAPEASALHPPLQPARPSRQLVDDREAVPLVEVDEQEREVLDGGVGHRDEEARPGLVDVPRVEREQPGLAAGQVGPPLLQGQARVAEQVDHRIARLGRLGAGTGRDRLPRLAPAQAHDVQPRVVREEQLGGVRVHRAGPRAPDPAVHPRQAVRRQVAERQPGDPRPEPDQHGLLELAEGHRLGVGGVRQRPARQGHPEAEAA